MAADASRVLISHLNELLVRATDLPGVVEAALDLIVSYGATNVSVFIADREGAMLSLAGQRNLAPDLVDQWRYLDIDEDTLATRAVRERRAQRVDDLHATEGDLRKTIASARRSGFRSAIALPLMLEGRPVGALACGFKTPLSAGDARVAAIEAIAQTIAIAIEHARLSEEVRQREADLALLVEAGKLFTQTLDLDTTLENVARIAALAIGDACMILLLDEDGAHLRLAANYHRDPEEMAARREFMERHPTRADAGAIGEVIRTGQPMLIGDPSRHPLARPNYIRPLRITSWVAAPISYRGETLGALAASSTTPGVRFDRRQLELASSLAAAAAPAIANARLFRQVAREHVVLESVLSNLPEAVLMVAGPEGRLAAVNRAAYELLGLPLDIGAPMVSWLPDLDWRDGDKQPFSPESHPLARASRGETVLGCEIIVDGRGRPRRAILGNFAPVVGPRGELIAAVGVMQDITARRELEREKDDFLAIAAHELRSPLTVIRGQAQLLSRLGPQLPPGAQHRLAVLRDQVDRMSELATRLLDASRIGMERMVLIRSPVDLNTLADAVRARFAHRSERHQLVVEPAGEPVVGHWDRTRLEQVLGNLIENAIRYSPGGGRVALTVSRGEADAWIQVRDEGVGIAPENLPRLFQRHSRITTPADPGWSAGFGLGLYISRAIVEAHGGEISVESALGQGSCFSIRLPLAASQAAPPARQTSPTGLPSPDGSS